MNDLQIYRKAAQLLKKGRNVALVTVISTAGSAPGRVGYKMLVWGKGESIGTVGGGSTEAEIISTAKNILPQITNQVFRFDLDGTGKIERGICGGSIEFLIESFEKKSLPLFQELSAVLEIGSSGVLISGKKSPGKIFVKKADELDTTANINLSHQAIESLKKVISDESFAKKTFENRGDFFIEAVSEQPMVFIFGAGHLSFYISKYAKSLNFRVTVCDDRVEFANRDRFPDADKIILEDFENVFEELNIDKNSYIVIVTKGHKSDEIVLENALKTNAKYIGMIGSKRKTLTILERLNAKGIPAETLNRVFSPIGISIGAVTPQEIALSIVCELVKIRRLGDACQTNHMKMRFSTKLKEK